MPSSIRTRTRSSTWREIVRLYPRSRTTTWVSGYRIDRKDPPIRLRRDAVSMHCRQSLLGNRVRDVKLCIQLFRRSFFERVQLSRDGFLIDADCICEPR